MTRPESRGEIALSIAAFFGSLALNAAAVRFVESAGNLVSPVPDTVLKHLPLVDTRFVYLWGAALFIIVAFAATLTLERGRLGYIARLYAALIAVRSGLMVLTPMHVPVGEMTLEGHPAFAAVRYFTVHNDLFFSLHTALPFLGFLAFRNRPVKLACLGFSIVLAAAVLLGRNHYSIDVAGAYLITYSVFRLVPAPEARAPRTDPARRSEPREERAALTAA